MKDFILILFTVFILNQVFVKDPRVSQYYLNVIMAGSKLVRALVGGNGSETLSHAVAIGYLEGHKFCRVLKPIIDTLFYWLTGEKDHVMNSLGSGADWGRTLWHWGNETNNPDRDADANLRPDRYDFDN